MADLAIITLSRTPEYVERLSAALAMQQGAPDYEKFLVANGDVDAVRAAAVRGGWSGLSTGHVPSFSEGCNLGVEHTTEPRILLLNDDVVPHQNFLAALWDHRDDAEIVGALLLHKQGTVNHAGTTVWVTGCRTDHLGRGDERSRWDQEFAVVPSCTFAAALIRRETWNALGGLDEAYCYGWEDTDFCLRAIDAGCRVGVARRAVAVHDECGTRPRGGTRDQDNYAFFAARWRDRLGPLLESYCRREHNVEGAFQ